jgi:hypothetical protein
MPYLGDSEKTCAQLAMPGGLNHSHSMMNQPRPTFRDAYLVDSNSG